MTQLLAVSILMLCFTAGKSNFTSNQENRKSEENSVNILLAKEAVRVIKCGKLFKALGWWKTTSVQ